MIPGKKLNRSVVQRIQRFGQGSIFKRTVLQSIAAELLSPAGTEKVHRNRDEDDDDELQDVDGRIDATASGGECLKLRCFI